MIKQQAYSMLGKNIEALFPCDETGLFEIAMGQVQAVTQREGNILLYVNGVDVPIERVQVVHTDGFIQSIQNLNNNIVTQQNLALIGRYVQAVEVDNDGEITAFHEGRVDHVRFDVNGTPVLIIGTTEVRGGNILSIGDGMRLIGRQLSAERMTQTGDYELVTGRITGVNFRYGNAYIQIDDGARTVEARVQRINLVTDAISEIGREVSFRGVSGPVESVVIVHGVPHIVVDGFQINYAEFRNIDLSTNSDDTDD
jgi:hypothetical protein